MSLLNQDQALWVAVPSIEGLEEVLKIPLLIPGGDPVGLVALYDSEPRSPSLHRLAWWSFTSARPPNSSITRGSTVRFAMPIGARGSFWPCSGTSCVIPSLPYSMPCT